MSSLTDPDGILIYDGDELKEFMTAAAYATLNKLDVEKLREKLRKEREFMHNGKLIKAGIFFR